MKVEERRFTDVEIDRKVNHKGFVGFITAQKLRWFRYLCRWDKKIILEKTVCGKSRKRESKGDQGWGGQVFGDLGYESSRVKWRGGGRQEGLKKMVEEAKTMWTSDSHREKNGVKWNDSSLLLVLLSWKNVKE